MSKTRTIRRILGRDIKALAERELHVLNKVLKPKPKLLPQFVWAWLTGIFIDHKRLLEIAKKYEYGKR